MRGKFQAATAAAVALIGMTAGGVTTAGAGQLEGFYAGISVAAGTSSTRWAPDAAPSSTLSPRGVLAGITGGYNWINGSVLAGVEADYNFGKMSVTGSSNLPGATYPVSVSNLGSVRGRLGWVATPALMVYATGGYGVGSTSAGGSAPGFNSFNATRSASGLVVGAGSEYAFDKNWTVKGEYLHYSLGTVNLSNADTGGNGGLTYSNGVNLFKVGVNYKF